MSDTYDLGHAVEKLWAGRAARSGRAPPARRWSSGRTRAIRWRSTCALLKILERKVGCRVNSKGYKVLPHYFRVIQGDGNNDEEAIDAYCAAITAHGYARQHRLRHGRRAAAALHRDTQKFAFKLCEATVDGRTVSVAKNPVTDAGKASKSGHLDSCQVEGRYQTVPGPRPDSALVTVFENGEIRRRWTFDEVRARAEAVML